MRDRAADFVKAGARLVLVGMAPPEESKEFLDHFKLPFEMICDPDRKLYEAYGLKRMGNLGFLSPSLTLKGISAILGGNSAGMPKGDVKQLAGAFIINREGRIRFRYLSADPSDFPPAEDLLETLITID